MLARAFVSHCRATFWLTDWKSSKTPKESAVCLSLHAIVSPKSLLACLTSHCARPAYWFERKKQTASSPKTVHLIIFFLSRGSSYRSKVFYILDEEECWRKNVQLDLQTSRPLEPDESGLKQWHLLYMCMRNTGCARKMRGNVHGLKIRG